jgi:hypothetical protein
LVYISEQDADIPDIDPEVLELSDREYAIGKPRTFRRLVGVAGVGETVIDAALAAPRRDLKDGIQLHCAVANGMGTLITRHMKRYPKDRSGVMDPVRFLGSKAREKKG